MSRARFSPLLCSLDGHPLEIMKLRGTEPTESIDLQDPGLLLLSSAHLPLRMPLRVRGSGGGRFSRSPAMVLPASSPGVKGERNMMQPDIYTALTALDNRLVEALQRRDIALVRSAWLLAQPDDYRLERRQDIEARVADSSLLTTTDRRHVLCGWKYAKPGSRF